MVVAKRAAGPPAPARATPAQRTKGRPPTTTSDDDNTLSGVADGSDGAVANGDRIVSISSCMAACAFFYGAISPTSSLVSWRNECRVTVPFVGDCFDTSNMKIFFVIRVTNEAL